ncbi:MAG: hypothetical protein U0744_07935 [Gemmataceae bacterium]
MMFNQVAKKAPRSGGLPKAYVDEARASGNANLLSPDTDWWMC